LSGDLIGQATVLSPSRTALDSYLWPCRLFNKFGPHSASRIINAERQRAAYAIAWDNTQASRPFRRNYHVNEVQSVQI